MPPHAELDFTIVKKSELPPSNVLRPARWWSAVPVWAQAAAAMLVLAAGAAIANVQVTIRSRRFLRDHGMDRGACPERASRSRSGRTGRRSLESRAGRGGTATAQRDSLDATSGDAGVAARGSADDAIMRRVQQLITEAEKRHSQELAVRLIDFPRDVNMQRRADLMNIARGLDELRGAAAATAPD